MLQRQKNPLLLLSMVLGLTACSSDVTQPALDSGKKDVRAAIGVASTDVSDGQGTAWRQLTETTGLTWTQVAALCPRDGVTPCWGSIGAINLSGYVWATDAQVVQLTGRYEPAILTSRTLSGAQYAAGVSAFFTAFHPTNTGGCSGSGYILTCSFGAHVSGWTATSTYAGSAISATIQSGFFADPFISVVPDASVNSASAIRGLFLWRADGSGGTGIVAHDDSGSVSSPYKGTAVENVLANDSLAGSPATVATVTIAQLSSTNAGLTLDVGTGAVNVASGVRVGTETLTYRICERARPSNCASASVMVTIAGNRVDANDDAGSAKTGGGTAIANVLANDTFAGGPATPSNVSLATITPDAQMTLQANGALTVAAGASVGTHTMTYGICETGNPTNCDQATATVTVTAYVIDAVEDEGNAPSNPGGAAVASVLANDRFDGGVASLQKVQLTQVASTSPAVTLDVGDGSVDVAAGAPGGVYYLDYQLCELASLANCDQARVKVTIVPQSYVISSDRHRVNEGSGGSFTVRLSQPPSGNVSTAVSYLAGTLAVSASTATLTFTPANWNRPQTITFSTIKDSGRDDNAGSLQLSAPGIAGRVIVINGLDTDRKSTNPVTMIGAPYNGETVSGLVSFWGSATDSDGYTVDGKFYVDGVRTATVASNAGSFRPAPWNSATVANGWHVLELRVTDNGGNDGRMLIKVYVSN